MADEESIYNTTHYYKQKAAGLSKSMKVAADKQGESKLYSQLECELKNRNANFGAITQLQEFTLRKRRIEEANVDSNIEDSWETSISWQRNNCN